ncbi:MAG: glycerophosphodiester phosphodiesterase [Clostridia bacterium]|nr:glycerophosphodiester phosphodiesterase [Clostridia bacterium]
MGWLIAAVCAAAAGAALWLFLIFPGRPGPEKRGPFANVNFAHRGLYSKNQDPPENSLPAFDAAAEAGFGIELDVQLTQDGEVVVFHDDAADRACGEPKRVDEYTLAELRALTLFGGAERIPLFSEVLALVGGRVPLLVELKTGKRNAELCEKTYALLKNYGGEYCMESFDPRIVAWFRKNAPEVLRGQLSQQYGEFRGYGFGAATAFLLSRCMLNCIARADFIAYNPGKRPLSVKAALRLGSMCFLWIVRRPEDAKNCDSAIFEHFVPDKR